MSVIQALSGKLGAYKQSGEQYSFNCPFCKRLGGYIDVKFHLHVSLEKNAVHCFRCNFSGSVNYLLSRLSIRGVRVNKHSHKQHTRQITNLVIPFDFIFVNRQTKAYLRQKYLREVQYAIRRGLRKETSGYFAVCREHVVVFDSEANVSHYYCRNIDSKDFSNPSRVPVPVYFVDRVAEHGVQTLILTEGPFDAFAWWQGSIMFASCLLGKNISDYQMKTLVELVSSGKVKELTLALDSDAVSSTRKAVQKFRYEIPSVDVSIIKLPKGVDADEVEPYERVHLFRNRKKPTLTSLLV